MALLKLKPVVVLMLTYYLIGCSAGAERNNKRPNAYQQSLETKILADGSKVFDFSLVLKQLKNTEQNGQMMAEKSVNKTKRSGDSERKDGRGNTEKQRDEKPRSTTAKSAVRNAALQAHFQERLANLSILKMFCRQGYFILEEYADVNEMSIKAECRESASVDDYTKFTKAK